MEQYLYTLMPTHGDMLSEGLTDKENEIVARHFAYVSDLKDKGVVKLAGRTTTTDSSSFGVIIFEAKDEEAAREIMAQDPGVVEGVHAAKLFPFRIALMGDPVE